MSGIAYFSSAIITLNNPVDVIEQTELFAGKIIPEFN
jgi:hypothetical protein